jgi:hypothetical protein
MTTISVRYLTIKDPLGLNRTAWFICENGRPTGFYGYKTQDEAERQAAAMRQIRKVSA